MAHNSHTNFLSRILDTVTECMGPVIPILVAGGIVKVFDLLLSYIGILPEDSTTEQILSLISDAPLYFLPFLVAWSTASHFQASIPAAIASVGTMLSPTFISLVDSGKEITFAGLRVIAANYSYSTLPIILLIAIMSGIEKLLHRHMPKSIDDILTPYLLLLVTSLLGILIIGPIGTIAGNAFSKVFIFLTKTHPVLAWSLFSGLSELMIITGVHWVFVAIALTSLGAEGMDIGIMVGFFLLTMAQSGMAFAVYCKAKNDKALRKTALTCGITVLLTGTTEPSIFGIALKYKWPLITSIIGAAAAGIYQGIATIRCYIYAFPGIVSCLMFSSNSDPKNIFKALIAGGISFTVSFLLTYLFPGKLISQKVTI